MHRQHIKDTLHAYRSHLLPLISSCPTFDIAHENETLDRFLKFIEQNDDCFERTLNTGHVTGSALIVDRNLTQIALCLHAKLNKWLQFGGHADGCSVPHEVALREAEEESGLKNLRFLGVEGEIVVETALVLPFDLDIHTIPTRKSEAEHQHYDLRFLLIADDLDMVISDESVDLKWFSMIQARRITDERSMQRQFDKLEWLLPANFGRG